MITNNVTVESQLATSAATFLKWEEVYIFCFLQSETLELGDPRIATLPLCLPLVRVCLVALSSPSGAFSFHCDLISRGEFICSWLPPPLPSISDSSQRLVLLLCLSLSALFLLPSKLKGLSQMSCLSLHWACLPFQTFAGGFAALTCSFAHLWIPAAWMRVCVFVFETMYM